MCIPVHASSKYDPLEMICGVDKHENSPAIGMFEQNLVKSDFTGHAQITYRVRSTPPLLDNKHACTVEA